MMSEGLSGLFVLAALLIFSFPALTVVAFRWFRLPRKLEQYRSMSGCLDAEGLADSGLAAVMEEEYSWRDYLIPLAFVTTFNVFGFYLLLFNHTLLFSPVPGTENNSGEAYRIGSLTAVVLAFAGAYAWSVQDLLRRLAAIDLPPGAFYNIGIRMVFCSFVSLVFYHFIAALPPGEYSPAGIDIDLVPDWTARQMMPVIAFLTGIYPERPLYSLTQRLQFTFKGRRAAAELPLEMLEGITTSDRIRFSGLGIENVQHLVHANLEEILLKTPFRPLQVVDWMAQGRLCLYFRDETRLLRDAGVRTIFDLRVIGNEGALEELGQLAGGIDPRRLEVVCRLIEESPASVRLLNVQNCLRAQLPASA